jgi:hypothetical protein
MKQLRRMIMSVLATLIGSAAASPVLAQISTEPASVPIALGANDPKDIGVNIINVSLTFLALIFVLLILYGGFLWMTAAGNDDKVSKAKQLLLAAVIGLLILLAAYGITVYLISTLGSATGSVVGTPTP